MRLAVASTPFSVAPSHDEIALTASIGLAVFPADGDDTRSLYHAADTALYATKRCRRNAVCAA